MDQIRDDIPAHVDFQMGQEEDRAATIKNGTYTARDVEFVYETPPYSRDCNIIKVQDWLARLEADVRNNRIPQRWRDGYVAKYKAWKEGQEIPEDGVPIKGWSMISPAQQTNLLNIGVRTVEALAKMNDEGMKRYGMGALDLKNRATAWLKTAKEIGPTVQENAALKAKVETLETTMKEMAETIKALKAADEGKRKAA